ncbi:MAG: glycoside hydrolase family 28 protein [Prevotella sp.]|nr:glycoside hydrolase family 28 protein [Prevotella sp.]
MTKRLWTMGCLLMTVLAVAAADYGKYYQNLPVEVKRVEAVVIPANQVMLTDCGAVGDGMTLCTEAFEKGISRLSKLGGGRLVVPEGVWLTGPIMLKDNIDLHLEKNAIVLFSPDKRLFLDKAPNAKRVYPCIRASKRTNIAITGEGVLNGNGQQWRPVKRGKNSDAEWNQYQAMGGQVTEKGDLWYPWQMNNGYPDIADTPQKQEGMRNDLIRLTDCRNVLVEGVTIMNSPRFHLHPCYCENVIIDGVTVLSEWNVQNGDGIDLSDCHRALIVNSTVSVGDDGLCMKSGLPQKAPRISGCRDIVIQDNTVLHAHGGFVLGSETASGVERMVVRHNRFIGTDVGLRFKSGLGRGGQTKQLFVSDIMMTDIKDEAIIFQCDYVNRAAGDDGKTPTFTEEQRRWAPDFSDIHITNVVCHGCATAIKASGISGLNCVHDIDISNTTIIYNKVERQIDEKTARLHLTDVRLISNKAK